MTDKVPIRRLPTGVPGLDAVLGGGVPEFSFNVIAGAPGAGKTTLVQQIMFALASADRLALFFTVLGEPPLKMLRYQQQFEFFDLAKVNASVRFINLAQEALERWVRRGVEAHRRRRWRRRRLPSSSSTRFDRLSASRKSGKRKLDLQDFVQQLGVRLTGWQATTFLVGEFRPGRDRGPSRLHGRGRARVAVPEHRSQFDGAQDASHEDARAGAHSRPAHLSHHRSRHSGLPATHSRAAGSAPQARRSADRHGCPSG